LIARDALNARWGGKIEKLNARLENNGAFFLLMMRLAHVPYSLVNYSAGATSIPLRTFCWTTSLGILPGTMIFVFVGTRIPTLKSLAEKGAWQLFDPLLFGVLAATVLFPLLIRWSIQQYRRRIGSSKDIDLLEMDGFDSWKTKGQTNGAH